MSKVKMPHQGHEEHLCYLHNLGWVNEYFIEYKKMVRGGKYVCRACGRVAASDKNLCAPEEL